MGTATGVTAGREAWARVARVAAELGQLAASCYGPAGRFQLVQPCPDGGVVTVTTASRRLFPRLALRDPVARSLVSLTEREGDGGLFVLLLACRLISRAAASESLRPREVIRGYRMAAQACDAALACRHEGCEDCVGSVELGDPHVLTALARAAVAPKALGVGRLPPDRVDHLAALVAQAALLGAPLDALCRQEAHDAVPAPHVRVCAVAGAPPSATACIPGGVAVDVLRPPGAAAYAPESPVAVFDGPLALPTAASFYEHVAVPVRINGNGNDDDNDEDGLCRALVALVGGAGGLVACQKTIDPRIARRLTAAGVAVWPRLSARHAGAVCACAHATAIPHADTDTLPLERGRVGRLAALRDVVVGGRRYVLCVPCEGEGEGGEGGGVATLVLAADDEQAAEELEAAVRAALRTVNGAIGEAVRRRESRACVVAAGAGCAEVCLAALVRRMALDAPSPGAAHGVDLFAQCLEDVAGALGGGATTAGTPPSVVVAALRRANQRQPEHVWGWDPLAGRPRPVAARRAGRLLPTAGAVLEWAAEKARGVLMATEAASALLRVQTIVESPY